MFVRAFLFVVASHAIASQCSCESSCHTVDELPCCPPILCAKNSNETCANYGCGTFNREHACQCNSKCGTYGDCCSDYQQVCKPTGGVFCPNAPSKPDDRRADSNTLKIVAWNVDWLFTNVTHDNGKLICPGTGSDSCDWDNQTIALAHLDKVVEQLKLLDGDIVALEEVEDCDTLRNISSYLPDLNYQSYMHVSKDTYTGQNPGILTRIDPVEDLEFSDEEVKFPVPGSTCASRVGHVLETDLQAGSHGCSKHYRARFQIDEHTKLSIFGVHLLAIPDSASRCPEREAQATVVANLVKKAVAAGDEIIVLGDFNDYDDSVADVNDNKPISSSLKILRDAGDLTNIASKMKKSERYSDWYNADGGCEDRSQDHSMIDHMLVSANLLGKLKDVGIAHNWKNGCGCLYSDHWPVYATFDMS